VSSAPRDSYGGRAVEASPKRLWLERIIIVTGAVIIAVPSARFAAGSWHDGSRLATAECLVDHRTLAIDESIYVRVPEPNDSKPSGPYSDDFPAASLGTRDLVRIDGHFYSHQPPVLAFLMAAEYQAWKWCTGLTARDRPDLFYFFMTLATSGLGYVMAVVCTYEIATRIQLPLLPRLALPVSLAFSTAALVYVRNVNNHLILLGVTSVIALGLVCLTIWKVGEKQPNGWLFSVGSLTGLSYAIDPALGAVLVACTVAWVIYRFRQLRPVGLFVLSAMTWVVLHHVVNYAVGGTLRPYGAVLAYLQWPGSAFDEQSMTGVYHHASPWELTKYAARLLIGPRGLLITNPPLLLGVLGVLLLLQRRLPERPVLFWAIGVSAGTWIVYALFSNNYSGECYSIRWFIPLLAPGFMVLSLFLKYFPRYEWALVIISVYGAYFAVDAWMRGPWKAGVVASSSNPPHFAHLADGKREFDSP
jgi:hypothetical protein